MRLKGIQYCLIMALSCVQVSSASAKKSETPVPQYEANWKSLDQRTTPQWFTDAKFGIFIHWGVYSVPAWAPVGAYAEWYWNALTRGKEARDAKDKERATWKFHVKNYGENFPYQDFAPLFKVELFNPDYWAEVFARSGAKYVVLTSKHHEGFPLWPSEHASKTWGRPWNSMEIGPKRDLLGDLTTAVRRKGLKMGFYYSLYEWYNPLWLKDRKRFVEEHLHPQFKDLVTRYRPSLIFADGEWDMPSLDWKSEELLAWLFNESPVREEVVINDRWGKETRHRHGGYYTTEYASGLADSRYAWEENRGMGYSFGYNRQESLSDYRTGEELILMLVDLVSRGGNLLLDIGPTGDGRIPVIMEERLRQIGDWLRVNGEAIYETQPWRKSRQWSAGKIPETRYGTFMTGYDISKMVGKRSKVEAVIEAFFTVKKGDLFAIIPRWPGKQFVLKELTPSEGSVITLLGMDKPLKWERADGNLVVSLPELSADLVKSPYAYVLKLSGIR